MAPVYFLSWQWRQVWTWNANVSLPWYREAGKYVQYSMSSMIETISLWCTWMNNKTENKQEKEDEGNPFLIWLGCWIKPGFHENVKIILSKFSKEEMQIKLGAFYSVWGVCGRDSTHRQQPQFRMINSFFAATIHIKYHLMALGLSSRCLIAWLKRENKGKKRVARGAGTQTDTQSHYY